MRARGPVSFLYLHPPAPPMPSSHPPPHIRNPFLLEDARHWLPQRGLIPPFSVPPPPPPALFCSVLATLALRLVSG